jgi:hypothetical protein
MRKTHRQIVEDLFTSGSKLFDGIYSMIEPDYDPVDDEVAAGINGTSNPRVQEIYLLTVRLERKINSYAQTYSVEVSYFEDRTRRVIKSANLLDFLVNARINHSINQIALQ